MGRSFLCVCAIVLSVFLTLPAEAQAFYMNHFKICQAFLDQELYDDAIQECSEAIALSPDFAFSYAFRGIAYSKKGDYDKAIKDFTRAIGLEIDDRFLMFAYGHRGDAYSFKGSYDKAIEDFTRAIALDPDWVVAYHNRGACLSWKGRHRRSDKRL